MTSDTPLNIKKSINREGRVICWHENWIPLDPIS